VLAIGTPRALLESGAGIDGEGDAGDVAGLVRGEEQHGVGDVTDQVAWFWIMTVSTEPGWTVLTRIMSGASSLASVRISPTTPCLAAT
jgi:hypothetical protein